MQSDRPVHVYFAAMKILLRIIKTLLLGLIALIFISLAIMFAMDPVVTTRLVSVPFGAKRGPLELVKGGPLIQTPMASAQVISRHALDEAIAYGQETGTHALIVYHADGIQLEHYYPGYDADSISSTQSMHKSVLSILVGIAISEGHIGSVDDSASLYLTEWAGDERSKITIRQMLQQTSGIDFATFGINPLGGFFQLMLGSDVTPAALNLPLEVEPGTRFDYNSAGPQNMGLLIQQATGMRYAQYLSEALWQHLGVPDAWVTLDSEEHAMPRTSCCLEATARSWLHLGLLHLHQGRIGGRPVVPADWMRATSTPSELNPNYGYFTWLGTEHSDYRYYNRKTTTRVLHSEPYVAPDVIFFDGFGGQRVYIIPSRQLVIVRIGAITPAWDDAYLPNVIVRGLPQVSGMSREKFSP
jgi:CubicO group peptidase (beta-lactamase class C family)